MGQNLDIVTIGEGLIELSSDKSLTYADSLDKYYGGDTLCSAVAASRLGSGVGYITRVGNDYFKEFLMESWQLEGLDISQVKLVDGFNGLYFIARSDDGSKEYSFYRKKTAASKISIDDIDEEYIKSANIVYSTGVTQALSLSAKEAVKHAFMLAKDNNLFTAYDPNYYPKLWSSEEAKDALEDVIEYVDILFLNIKYDSETVYVWGTPLNGYELTSVRIGDYILSLGQSGSTNTCNYLVGTDATQALVTLNNVTEETAKVYKISRLKLEINSFNKLYHEKMNKMGKRLLLLIENGEIDSSLFEPEYSGLIQVKEKIEEMEAEVEGIKGNLKFGFGKKKTDDNIVDVKPEVIKDDEPKENGEK